jgi:phosphate ABC transporter permease protein PstC
MEREGRQGHKLQALEVHPEAQRAQWAWAKIHRSRSFVRKGRALERGIELFLFLNSLVAIVAITLIFLFLFQEGVRALTTIPLSQFIGVRVVDYFSNEEVFRYIWQPVGSSPKFSLIPLISGTFLVALPATLIASGFGIGCGLFLSEIAKPRLRELAKPFLELLAGIPTVVIGFFMLAIGADWIQRIFHTSYRLNALVGAIGVSCVIIPVIASLVEDVLHAVPREIREASYALGATRSQTVLFAILPYCSPGIAAAVILGMGRAIGETMIVVMATGNAAQVTFDIFKSVRTMTATIAGELGAVAQGSNEYYALFLVGSVLFTITFFMNFVTEFILDRVRKRLRM